MRDTLLLLLSLFDQMPLMLSVYHICKMDSLIANIYVMKYKYKWYDAYKA